MKCKECGEAMVFAGKDTFSGDDIYEYRCLKCGHEEWERGGPALWTYMLREVEETPEE